MITSQRILIIFFTINVLIGIATHIYLNPTLSSYVGNGEVVFGQEQTNVESQVDQYGSDDTLYSGIKNKDYITETTVGNPITWTQIIFDVLNKGFNPFAITPSDYDTYIENAFAWLLNFVKSIFSLIAILEIYMLFKNRKTS